MSAFDAVTKRRSYSKVGALAPTRDEVLRLLSAAGRVADHSSLRPWRVIELRGADRERLGAALSAGEGKFEPSSKPLRAPLLLAIVSSPTRSDKVPEWEQEAVASGIAHMLSLLLDEAGWGVIWRTGHATRSPEVAKAHGLRRGEKLLGWLYVGSKPDERERSRRPVDAERFLNRFPGADSEADAEDARREAEKALTVAARRAKKEAARATKHQEKAKKALDHVHQARLRLDAIVFGEDGHRDEDH